MALPTTEASSPSAMQPKQPCHGETPQHLRACGCRLPGLGAKGLRAVRSEAPRHLSFFFFLAALSACFSVRVAVAASRADVDSRDAAALFASGVFFRGVAAVGAAAEAYANGLPPP